MTPYHAPVLAHNGSMASHEDAMAERLARAGVTEREAEVLSALAGRMRNREIADQLHVSVRTVESHVAALLRKLGVADRMALAEIGVQVGRIARTGTVIPSPLTSLVGREDETSELMALLGSYRLVTLTGPRGWERPGLRCTSPPSAASRSVTAPGSPIWHRSGRNGSETRLPGRWESYRSRAGRYATSCARRSAWCAACLSWTTANT
jgi:DNA-binding CsgD family transcriptional regulator